MQHVTSANKGSSASTATATDEHKRHHYPYRILNVTLWCVGLLALALLSTLVYIHPQPFPIDLTITNTIQGPHPVPCIHSLQNRSSIDQVIEFISTLNDPIPSITALAVFFVVMLICRWFQEAILLVLAVSNSSSIFLSLGALVGRERPGVKDGICVINTIPFHSYPSGHVLHDVTFYGFLLYLTLSKPVRKWRYHWILLPFQVFAVLDILTIGYSRLLRGEHWFTDVAAGYLAGVLWLCFFIFLDHRTTHWRERRREKKKAEKRMQTHKA